jgi:hypothetical protein
MTVRQKIIDAGYNTVVSRFSYTCRYWWLIEMNGID